MKNHHHNHPIHPKAPTHEVIAERAFALWNEQGKPEDCQDANWYEAERQLGSRETSPPAPAQSAEPKKLGATLAQSQATGRFGASDRN